MQKYIDNTTGNTMFVGGAMIPPGEGRMVEVADEVQAPAEQDAPPSLDEVIRELLKKPVAQVVAALEAASYEALDRMAALEAEGGNRKTLLAAIGTEQIRRADLAMQEKQAQERADLLATAQTDLAAAQAALDASGDTDEHPALEAAVAEATARVEALSPAAD